MEKSSNRMWISLVALAATVLLLSSLGGDSAKQKSTSVQTDQVQSQSETSQPKATATPATISANDKEVSYTGAAGETALVALNKAAKIATKSTSYGDMVTAIEGVSADGTSEYWAFYVNGQMASEGAGTYIVKDGDKLMWKVEAIE